MSTVQQRTGAGLLALVLVAMPVRGLAAQESAYHTDRCPLPAQLLGYPVSVGGVEPAFAAALAEAAARRWEVPSRRRASFQGLGQVRGRIVPPEPRWADDWLPGPEHTARLAVTLYRDGREPVVVVERPSGDRLFDRSLATILGRSPYPHPIPPFPAGLAADSVRVRIGLGEESADSAAVVRFAAQQTPVRVVPGSLRPTLRRSGASTGSSQPSALIKYDIGPNGQISGIQVLRSTSRELGEGIVTALEQASFIPAQSNCRPIAQSVVQQFGG